MKPVTHIKSDLGPLSDELEQYYGEQFVTYVFLNRKLFSNYAQKVTAQDDGFETIISNPLYPCCQSADIVLKKSGDLIIIMLYFYTPDQELYSSNQPVLTWNYSSQLIEDKALYMTLEEYAQLRSMITIFPLYEHIEPLTKQDVARLLCFEAPHDDIFSLNSTLCDTFIKKLYLATDAPEGKKIVTILQDTLNEYLESEDPVTLQPSHNHVIIFQDNPDYLEWKPLSVTQSGYQLRLEPGFQILNI